MSFSFWFSVFGYAALRAVLYFDVTIGIVVGLENFLENESSADSRVVFVELAVFVFLPLAAVG